MHLSTSLLIWYAALSAAAVLVGLRGGYPERLTVAVFFAASVLTYIVSTDLEWARLKISVVLINVALVTWLLVLAMTSKRWWPMPASAFQIISLTVLILPAVVPAIRSYAYYFATVGWDYLTIAAVVAGCWLEPQPLGKPRRTALV